MIASSFEELARESMHLSQALNERAQADQHDPVAQRQLSGAATRFQSAAERMASLIHQQSDAKRVAHWALQRAAFQALCAVAISAAGERKSHCLASDQQEDISFEARFRVSFKKELRDLHNAGDNDEEQHDGGVGLVLMPCLATWKRTLQ